MGEYLCDPETGKNLKTHKVYDYFHHIKDFWSMKDITKLINK